MCKEIEILENPTNEIATQGAFQDTSLDNILYMADKADKYIAAVNRIMEAAIKVTCEYDWTLIGGKPYLQESGATKVARVFGISIEKLGEPVKETDSEGYVTYTYKLRLHMNGQFIDCDGSRSMRQDFFSKGKNGIKKPDEIIERDVKMAAYTNAVNNGIKRLIPGLRNIDISVLEGAGMKVQSIRGYSFKTGSKGGNSGKAEDSGFVCADCGAAITSAESSYSQGKFGRELCRSCQAKERANEQD